MKTWDAIYQEWQTDDGQIHAIRMGLLIRCKDCTHKEDCQWYYYSDDDYGYCKWAERREDETD